MKVVMWIIIILLLLVALIFVVGLIMPAEMTLAMVR